VADTVTLRDYLGAMRAADQRFSDERDRRYAEVKNAEEKALKVKEVADAVALDLARQIQTYKDEQHNGLLKQWQGERGTYVTVEKFDATVKPLLDFVSGQQARGVGRSALVVGLATFAALISAIVAIVVLLKK
jgi:hypothetical protein